MTQTDTYYAVLSFGPNAGTVGIAYRSPATATKAARRSIKAGATNVRIAEYATAAEARDADISDPGHFLSDWSPSEGA